eukprot:scaffold63650_cov83-Phaeocystis_antarctica.AAC.4
MPEQRHERERLAETACGARAQVSNEVPGIAWGRGSQASGPQASGALCREVGEIDKADGQLLLSCARSPRAGAAAAHRHAVGEHRGQRVVPRLGRQLSSGTVFLAILEFRVGAGLQQHVRKWRVAQLGRAHERCAPFVVAPVNGRRRIRLAVARSAEQAGAPSLVGALSRRPLGLLPRHPPRIFRQDFEPFRTRPGSLMGDTANRHPMPTGILMGSTTNISTSIPTCRVPRRGNVLRQ